MVQAAAARLLPVGDDREPLGGPRASPLEGEPLGRIEDLKVLAQRQGPPPTRAEGSRAITLPSRCGWGKRKLTARPRGPAMSCLVELLSEAGKGVEAQLKPQLAGFFGGVVRSYLPQRWVFVTEEGSATLGVETDGVVWARPGAEPSPDVTIRTSHAKLAQALKTRAREGLPPDPVNVTAHTTRGRTAFDFTRRRLGL